MRTLFENQLKFKEGKILLLLIMSIMIIILVKVELTITDGQAVIITEELLNFINLL